MSFDLKRPSIYFQVDTGPKVFRPLFKEPIGLWMRTIPAAYQVGPDGKRKTIRHFSMVSAEKSQVIEKAVDPLWDFIDNDQRYNRKGERQDFPMRPQFILPVWSYADNEVKILKSGNQIFEPLKEWHAAGNNIMHCDWTTWKVVENKQTSYKTIRNDATQFSMANPDQIVGKGDQMLQQAIGDTFNFKNEDAFVKYIHGQGDANNSGNNAYPFGANGQQPTQAAPAQMAPQQTPYVLGGATSFGQAPMQAPASQFGQAPQTAPAQGAFGGPAPVAPAAMGAFGGPAPVAPNGAFAAPATPAFVPPAASAGGFTPPAAVAPQFAFGPPPGVPAQMPAQMPMGSPMQNAVPPAPIQGQPTFAPPAQQPAQAFQQPVQAFQPPPAAIPQQGGPTQVPGQDPASIVVQSGKYQGKTLGFILSDDGGVKYLSFLKGHDPSLKGAIEALLSRQAPQSAPQQAMPAQAQTMAPVQAQAPVATPGNGAELQPQLARECTQMLMSVPEFQGRGVVDNLGPFLQTTIGTTQVGTASVEQLMALKNALQARGVSAAAR